MIAPADLALLPGRSNSIYLEGKLLPLTVAQARDLDLRDGQIVQALVQSRGGDDLSLLLRGKQVDLPRVPVTAGWHPGQSVNFQVHMSQAGLALLPTTVAAPGAPASPFFSRAGNLLVRPSGLEEMGRM